MEESNFMCVRTYDTFKYRHYTTIHLNGSIMNKLTDSLLHTAYALQPSFVLYNKYYEVETITVR